LVELDPVNIVLGESRALIGLIEQAKCDDASRKDESVIGDLLGVGILDSSSCRLVLRVLLDGLDLLVGLVLLGFWNTISACPRVRGGSNIPSTSVGLRFGALRKAIATARRIEGGCLRLGI
jgi:hypothetical protein